MSNENVEIVRRIYGFNWAAVGSREHGLDELDAIVAPEFESQLSPEIGGRVVKGVAGLREFGEALEQDFAEISYKPSRFADAGDGTVVVVGTVAGVARASKMPLSGEFGHIWKLAGGRAVHVEAHMSAAAALEAAGAESS
jgi:ketosteroid isomerase-like protein